jgi:hypothetical protein
VNRQMGCILGHVPENARFSGENDPSNCRI